MIYLELFWVFFITNLLGYGGGPATIPLVQREVVETFGWLTEAQFSETLAMGNALPGPIATKMAGFIGFEMGGVFGAVVALLGTVVPSLLLMILLMGILLRHKDSPQVKKLSLYVRPTIAVLLGLIVIQNTLSSWATIGFIHFLALSAGTYLTLERFKLHPTFVIAGALLYGAFLL